MPTSSDPAVSPVGAGSPGLTAGERLPAPLHPLHDGPVRHVRDGAPLRRVLAA